MTICDLCQLCRECGAVAWCEGDPGQIETPCPHFLPLCENCLDACPDCRKAMAEQLYKGDDYDPLADELYNTHAEAADAAYAARLPREKPGSPGTFEYGKGEES